ncbi:MAG TPA: preprotein translocase subunit SecY [Acidobacteriota bacterium]|jgi:preprotein translocase subunit SecY|nr:preprotein translocase subunit SecY [Acidobacteriota bacterium]
MSANINPIIGSVKNIVSIPDLRRRILFMLAMLAVYRVGSWIPTPGIDSTALEQLFARQANTIFGFLNMFSGGNLSRLSIFALGITPYITASIILQLLTVVWPYLERLSKEGELGRKKITQYTRYLTVALSLVQSFATAITLERTAGGGGPPIVPHPGWTFRFTTVITLTTGTAFIMWIGEQISERGIGNGISLIIFAGIVAGLIRGGLDLIGSVSSRTMSPITFALLLLMMVAVCAAVVFVERGQRRIPVQYAKRVVGRKMYGGQATHLPLRVNSGGVIPVIFAASIVAFPSTLGLVFRSSPFVKAFTTQLQQGYPLYNLLYVGGIMFFCFFYVAIIFNPDEVADNIRKYGGFIPGIRPGKRTAEYIDRVLTRLTFAGAIYLVLVALLPEFLITGFKVQPIPWVGPTLDNLLNRMNLEFITTGMGLRFVFGGTTLLIVVGVAMDTVQQVESQLIMRHYDGFLKKGRIRGRRA